MRAAPSVAVRCGAVCVALGALLTGPTSGVTSNRPADAGSRDAVVEALSGDETELERTLKQLEGRSAAVVVGLLLGDRSIEVHEPSSGSKGRARAADDEPQMLSRDERLRLLDKLPLLPADVVLDEIEGRLRLDSDLDLLLQSLDVLAGVGDPRGVAIALEAHASLEPPLAQHRLTREALSGTMAALVRVDGEALDELDRLALTPQSHPVVAETAIQALEGCEHTGALEILERMLVERPLHEVEVLRTLGTLAPRRAHPAWSSLGERVRARLLAPDPRVRSAAARACGQRADTEGFTTLVALLDDESARVRRSAHDALTRIARTDLGPRRDPWLAWWNREVDWRETELTDLTEALFGADPAHALTALRELSAHPWHRDHIVPLLETLVRTDQGPVGVSTCQTLARLGGPAATELLDALATDPSSALGRTAASLVVAR